MLAHTSHISLDAHYVLVAITHAGHLLRQLRSVVHSIAGPVTVVQAQRVGCRGEDIRGSASRELRRTYHCELESQGLSRGLQLTVALTGPRNSCTSSHRGMARQN